MFRKKVDVDVIDNILKAAVEAYPTSVFLTSLLHQYHERGGLSKKQLEGLYQKASKITSIAPHTLATLEAEILKRPTRYKSPSPATVTAIPVVKDDRIPAIITAILARYPQHKRVLFFKLKYDNNETFSATEITEMEKFMKILP